MITSMIMVKSGSQSSYTTAKKKKKAKLMYACFDPSHPLLSKYTIVNAFTPDQH